MQRRRMFALISLVLMALCASAAMAQPEFDLVFCVDGSGSLQASGFQTQINGTANAIQSCMPHDGSVRVTVIVFDADVNLDPMANQFIPPTIIDNTNAGMVSGQVSNLTFQGGQTNMTACINAATAILQSLPDAAPNQVIDISTDGSPGNPTAALQATDAAIAAGVDQVNGIGIAGTGGLNMAFLTDLAVNHGNGFAIQSNLANYAQDICGKVGRELDGCMTVETEVVCPMDGGTDFEVSLTFTNMLPIPQDPDESNVVIEAFLQNLPPDFTASPNYFSFVGNPICSTATPGCTNSSATLDFTLSYTGPLPVPDTMELWLAIHPEKGDCCLEPVEIDLSDCDCGQLLSERTRCRFTIPFTWNHSFTFQNLFSEEVNTIKLSPITPASPGIVFTSNIFPGLSLDPPPPNGTGPDSVSLTTVISGPAAVQGQEVCYRIRTERFDGTGGIVPCCSIENCITLPRCRFWPWPWPIEWAKLKFEDERWLLTDLDGGGGGAGFDLEQGNGFFVNWEALNATSSDAGVRLTTYAGEHAFATASASDERGTITLALDVPTGAVRQIELYNEGRLVGTLSGTAAITADSWPAGIAVVDTTGTTAFVWDDAVQIGGTAADQAAFIVESEGAEALSRAELTATGFESIAFEAYGTGDYEETGADVFTGGGVK